MALAVCTFASAAKGCCINGTAASSWSSFLAHSELKASGGFLKNQLAWQFTETHRPMRPPAKQRTNRTQVMSKSHAQAWTHARRHMRGQPQESTHARNHGRRNAASTHGRTNSRTDTRIHAHMDARTDERSHGHTHTRTDGRTDGGSDGRRHTCAHPRVHLLTGRRIHACTRRFG